MDVRASANPVLASARRWLDWVNARHPWSHNEHFHGWILRNLPVRRQAAVDVGCGTGVLAGKLAPHFARVTGIDADASMAAAATALLARDPGVAIRQCGFEDFASAAGDGEADLITMVAVLHHLCLDDTLARIPGLLTPGGRLLVVGLARVNSLPDLAVDLISAAANPVIGLIRHPRPARPADAVGQPVMPVRDPGTTLAEITAAARAHLPGVTVRRRLFFRYTLRWDKPPVTAPPPGPGRLASRLRRCWMRIAIAPFTRERVRRRSSVKHPQRERAAEMRDGDRGRGRGVERSAGEDVHETPAGDLIGVDGDGAGLDELRTLALSRSPAVAMGAPVAKDSNA